MVGVVAGENSLTFGVYLASVAVGHLMKATRIVMDRLDSSNEKCNNILHISTVSNFLFVSFGQKVNLCFLHQAKLDRGREKERK